MRLAHPPVTFRHEKLKLEARIPAARRYIREHGLNEKTEGGRFTDVGLIVQGGLANALLRALQQLGLADAFGASELPLLVLNVTYPLVPEELGEFALGRRALLVVEEGSPEYIEKDVLHALRRLDLQTPVHGKDLLPGAGEYTVEVIAQGLIAFAERYLPEVDLAPARAWLAANSQRRAAVPRPPSVRCPRARRASASAAPSGRCFRHSSWPRPRSGRCTSRRTSAAMRSPPSSPSAPATRSSATA